MKKIGLNLGDQKGEHDADNTEAITPPTKQATNKAAFDKYRDSILNNPNFNDLDCVGPIEAKDVSSKVSYFKNSAQWESIKSKQALANQIKDEDLLSRKADMDEIEQNEANRQKSITFLFPETENTMRLVPGGLTLIVAATNQGKSTMACNIVAPLIAENKRVLFLSNEESRAEVRTRVSCIRLNISYGNYTNNLATPAEKQAIKDDVQKVEHNLIVVGNGTEQDKYRTQNSNGMIQTIKSVIGKVDCVVIDYLQRVLSTDIDDAADWKAQKHLIVELDSIKHLTGCPLVIFAQVEPLVPNKKEEQDEKVKFESHHPWYRWRGSKDALLSATEVLEIFQDKKNKRTVLFAHKARFRSQDWSNSVIIGFDNGKFVPYTSAFEDKVSTEALDKLAAMKW